MIDLRIQLSELEQQIQSQQICEITQQVMQHLKPGKTFIARHLSEDITMTIILKVVFGIDEGLRFEKLKKLLARRVGGYQFISFRQ